LVFFLLNELYKIHSFYKFSLDSFIIVVKRAIKIVADRMKKKGKSDEAPAEGEEGEAPAEEPEEAEEEEGEMTPKTLLARVDALIDSITYQAFNYCRRGTFEDHKLIVSTMLCFRILIRKGLINAGEYAALIKKEVAAEPPH
jgi:dynein heavy chain